MMQVSDNLHLLERHLQAAASIKGYWEARAPSPWKKSTFPWTKCRWHMEAALKGLWCVKD